MPDRLGAQRFATDDFVREIQGLAARFTPVRLDGPDFRHRGVPAAPAPLAVEEVRRHSRLQGATLDDFAALLHHLSRLHPSRYGALIDGVRTVAITDVTPLHDQASALRLVVLVDRLYDRQVPIAASGTPWDAVFGEEMLSGGYREKYRRAISRLVALTRLGAENVET